MKHKIKLLFLIPTLQSGGSERVFSTIAQNMDPSVFEPIFVVLDGQNAFFQINKTNIRFIDLETPRVTKAFWKIRALIKKEKPDIVFSTLSHLNIMLIVTRFFIAPRSTRFVARESSVMSLNNLYQNPTWLFNLLTRWFYPRFDAIICQSKDMSADFVQNFGLSKTRLHIINNPINRALIEQKASEFSVSSIKIPRFVTVGRLAKGKGIDRLLMILSELNTPFVFDIIGDGTEKDNLLALTETLKLNDKVQFWGSLDNPFPIVQAADVFLFGSHHEGFPNVLIEAGACGVPVVAFDCKGGINEIIEDGVNGYIIADNDFGGFTKAILKTLKTPFNQVKIAEMTQKRFDLPMIIQQYEAVFKSLVLKN
jgi:glycosyltransferase involved in cell wall biosynthesis